MTTYLTAKRLAALAKADRPALARALASDKAREALSTTRAMCSMPAPQTLDERAALMAAFFVMHPAARVDITGTL